ncbi:hypothetical protein M0811_13208 [Anaeramoeba ignava]|uniref:N-alpha-acetyltransferase 40 n=1 Tax=Anaeramoeba ignava TaxID=1746090 RepID=A0A9Q0L7F3_ANAIG|nr:hypothetical protein M0811_13208 [Anaeramoeba ignava]
MNNRKFQKKTRSKNKPNQPKKRSKKKEKLKEELEFMKKIQEKLKLANEEKDFLQYFPRYTNYNKNGVNIKMEFYKEIPKENKQEIIDLLRSNMKVMYEEADGWGWNESQKFNELVSEEARFLVLKKIDEKNNDQESESKGSFAGFAHFRFVEDDKRAVVYLYELQLVPDVCGKGIGKFVMQFLELIVFKFNLNGLVLTCFTANSRALNFYLNHMKYSIDRTSPQDSLDEVSSYRILSKIIRNI